MKLQVIGTGLLIHFSMAAVHGAIVSWVGGSGDWTNTANWSTGALPGTNDTAVISPAASVTVTHSAGAHKVQCVQSSEAFVLSGGSLTVSTTFLASNNITLSGGTLQSAAVLMTNGAALVVSGASGTLNGVTINGVLDVGNTDNDVVLTVTNGLTLHGTLLAGNPTNSNNGHVDFMGSQTLGGGGAVVFGDDAYLPALYLYNSLRLPLGETTLTIGSGITIHGQNGAVGYDSVAGGPQNVTVSNQGTIACDVSGGIIAVTAEPFINQGMAQAINGGSLSLNVLQNSLGGTVTPTGGGSLSLGGAWDNAGTINATNATVNLGGTFALANLGTLNRSGGTVNVTGTLTNSGAPLVLDANTTGSWVLEGGTILGGTVLTTNGAALIVSGASGTLNGVTVNGVLDVGNTDNDVVLTVTNGLTLYGTLLAGNPTNSNNGHVDFMGSQTLGGGGAVVFGDDAYLPALYLYNSLRLPLGETTLTIGSGITIHGQNGAIGYDSVAGGPQNVTVSNQGTIACDVSGGIIAVTAEPFINQGMAQAINGGSLSLNVLQNSLGGTVTLTGGGSLSLGGSWDNAGTINATNATVNLGGTFALANLGTLNRSGGTVNVTGTLTNSGAPLVLDANTTGSWVLEGGTILGGTVLTTNGAALIVSGASGTLNGVTVNGVLDVGNTGNDVVLTVTNGLRLYGTLLAGNPTNSNNGYVDFMGSQTLGGSGAVVFGDDAYLPALYFYNSLRLPLGGTTLTIGSGITIHGQNGEVGYDSVAGGPQNVTVSNQGTIACDVSSGIIAVTAEPFTNQGMAQAINGGSLSLNVLQNSLGGTVTLTGGGSLSLGGSWDNAGTINATNATVNLGGTFALANLGTLNRSGGTVNVTGTLTNSSAPLVLDANTTGSWVLEGGTILGGTVLTTNGAALIVSGASGTLNGVTVNGVLDVGNTGNDVVLTVTNGLRLYGTLLAGNPTNSNNGYVDFMGSQTLGGSGAVVFGDDAYLPALYFYNSLRLPLGGTTLTIGSGITIHGQNGEVGYDSVAGGPQNVTVINQGTIACDVSGGIIAVTAEPFINQGTVAAVPGVVELSSGFNPSGGSLVCGLSTSSSHGQFQFAGNAVLGGTLDVVWLGGYVPAISNSFPVLTYGSNSGMFDAINLPPGPVWQTNFGATVLSFSIVDIGKLAITSEPSGTTNAGAILSPTVVQIEDSATGSALASNGVPVTISLGSGTGNLSGTLTRYTDATGKVTFNDLSLNLAGPKTLLVSASSSALTAAASSVFTIVAATPSQLVLATTVPSPQVNGVAFSPPPKVQVRDRFGNVVSNATVVVTAGLITGAGSLGGVTSVNASVGAGTVTFTNLFYRLAGTHSAESVVINFSSPGLVPVTNSPVMVDLLLTAIALQDHNSVIQIAPATDQGMDSWTVDGTNQLYQHWFWLREGASSGQFSLDTLGLPLGHAYNSNNVTLNYLGQGLSVILEFTLTGGGPGSLASSLAEALSIQNITNVPINLQLFEYADFDLAGNPEGDLVTVQNASTVVQQGKNQTMTGTILTPAPSFWEASWYAITLDNIEAGTPVTLSDELIPDEPGDQTYAYQWSATLGVGQAMAWSLAKSIGGTPQSLGSLKATLGASEVSLSWPTNTASGVQLQTSPALGAAANWTNVTIAPTVVNGQFQLSIPFTGSAGFYRLKN